MLGDVSTFKNTCSLRGFIFSLLLLFGCCGLIVAAQALNTGAAGENNILEVGESLVRSTYTMKMLAV